MNISYAMVKRIKKEGKDTALYEERLKETLEL